MWAEDGVMQVVKNLEASRAACPILNDDQIDAYLSRGDVPTGTAYIEVPPTKLIRQRGFWLRPHHRMHHIAALFLIITDVYITQLVRVGTVAADPDDQQQAFGDQGCVSVQVQRDHQALLFKSSAAGDYIQLAAWPWLMRWLSAWICSGDSVPATISPPRKPCS